MGNHTIILSDCYKKFTRDQDKACSPNETVKHFHQRLEETGLDVLKEVRRIDNGRLDIPVYFSVCGNDAYRITGSKKQMGKGGSPEQARASACMELAERFSLFSFMRNAGNFIQDTYHGITEKGYPVMPLEALTASVHDKETSPETMEKLLDLIPISWTWATNLTSKENVLIPFSWFYTINEFNGSSAGNTPEEAICQGLCEVVERHVSDLVSHNRMETAAIDLNSPKDPINRELLHKFQKNGIRVYLNDISLDTGIPTVAGVAIDPATFPETSEIVYTAGTSPNPEKAVNRALTEIAQLGGDFNTGSNYEASGLPKPESPEEIDYMTKTSRLRNLEDMTNLADDNIKKEIENCLTALKKISLDVYIINISHPDLKIPAIYTVIPGACFRERSRNTSAGLFAAKLAAEKITDPLESAARLTAMQEVFPGAYYLEFYLGHKMIESGRPEEAINHFKRALSLDPDYNDIPYIHSFLGDSLKDLGRYSEALDILEQGLGYDGKRPDMHNIMGVCYFKLQKYEKAIKHFHKAVELSPSSAIDYANLGVNYQENGNAEKAVKYLKIALSLDPALEFAQNRLMQLQT
ncbi:MAG: YcaO-like family protein [Thermodesulfobacteriota bacterium]